MNKVKLLCRCCFMGKTSLRENNLVADIDGLQIVEMPNCEKGRGGKWKKVGKKRWEEDREDDRKRKSEMESKEKFVCM